MWWLFLMSSLDRWLWFLLFFLLLPIPPIWLCNETSYTCSWNLQRDQFNASFFCRTQTTVLCFHWTQSSAHVSKHRLFICLKPSEKPQTECDRCFYNLSGPHWRYFFYEKYWFALQTLEIITRPRRKETAIPFPIEYVKERLCGRLTLWKQSQR